MAKDARLDEVASSVRFIESARPYVLLDRNLKIRAANLAYLQATKRPSDELLTRHILDAFPCNRADPESAAVAKLGVASFEEVLRTGQPSPMWVQRYDIPGHPPDDPFVLKYWSPHNKPVLDHLTNSPIGIIHHVEDVTTLWAPVLADSELASVAADEPTSSEWVSFLAATRTNQHIYEQLRRKTDQLQEALTSRILLEQAKGIVMAQRRCSPQEAFDTLRQFARSRNLNLHLVAERLVEKTSHREEVAADDADAPPRRAEAT